MCNSLSGILENYYSLQKNFQKKRGAECSPDCYVTLLTNRKFKNGHIKLSPILIRSFSPFLITPEMYMYSSN